jgi:hypothetical protein
MERGRKRGIYIQCKLHFGNSCIPVLLSGCRRDEEERRGAQEPLSSDSDQTEALALLSWCQHLSDVHFMLNCDITDQNWELSLSVFFFIGSWRMELQFVKKIVKLEFLVTRCTGKRNWSCFEGKWVWIGMMASYLSRRKLICFACRVK